MSWAAAAAICGRSRPVIAAEAPSSDQKLWANLGRNLGRLGLRDRIRLQEIAAQFVGTQLGRAAVFALWRDSYFRRQFGIAEFSAEPHHEYRKTGGGVAVDAYLPIVPAGKDLR